MSKASHSSKVKTSLSHMPSAWPSQLLFILPSPLSPAACCLLSASQLLLGVLLTCYTSLQPVHSQGTSCLFLFCNTSSSCWAECEHQPRLLAIHVRGSSANHKCYEIMSKSRELNQKNDMGVSVHFSVKIK